ncbi:acyltransferase family protein [Leucobacter salsicius]|uniref:acyltransferase family protein n=1 Tax=Leucobacter salsicius TaxID=664638 RepID=UPI00034569AB|nr:acyltransferase family protein [Leucobacter salsicius]
MNFSPATSTARFGGLDGLRAIAVALVLVYHFFPQLLPGGFLGVDIFFVISGFLITSLLIREKAKHGRVSLRSFWRRRARRLLPALGLVLLVCTSLVALVGGDLLVGIGRQLLGAATFVSNWVFIAAGADYFARDTPELFRNTWSLAIEEQFYIFLPLIAILLFAVCRRQTAALLLAVAGIASAIWMAELSLTGANSTRVYFGSDTHSFGLMLGAALAFVTSYSRGRTTPGPARQIGYSAVALGGFGALGVMVLTLPEGSALSFQGGFQLATVVALATVWAVTRPGAWIGRTIDAAPMRWVGERSYGIYLWHWPLLLIVAGAFPAAPQWQVALVTLAATLLCAAMSFRWVEQPVRQLGIRASLRLLLQPRRYTPKRRFVAIGLGAVLAVSVPATAYAVSQAPALSSAQAAIERGAALVEQTQPPAAKPAVEPTAKPTAKPQASEAEPPESKPSDSKDAGKANDAKSAKGKQTALPAAPRAMGTDITAVGDSVMLASAPELNSAFPGVSIDAAVSRGMGAGVGLVADSAAQGALRHVVVVGLGTNGTVTTDELAAIRNSAAGHPLILVNAHGDREWIPGVNETITAFAAAHRGVVVADWDGNVTGVPGALAGDEIHPNPSGGIIYAQSVQSALDALDTPAEAIGYAVPRR